MTLRRTLMDHVLLAGYCGLTSPYRRRANRERLRKQRRRFWCCSIIASRTMPPRLGHIRSVCFDGRCVG